MVRNWTILQEPENGSNGASLVGETNSTAAAAPSAGEDSSSSFDIESIVAADSYDDSGQVSSGEGETPAATPAKEVAQSAPAAGLPQPAATPVPSAAPPAAVAPPSPSAAPASAQPPTPVAATPPAAQGASAPPAQVDFAKHRQEYLPKLQELYKLSDQEVEQFRTNPEEALPALAARLHYEVQVASVQSIMSILPNLMSNFQVEQKRVQEADDKFYGAWPALKAKKDSDPKVEESIRQSIRAYKASNPQADMETVIKQAGLLAAISLGIPLESLVAPQAAAPVSPAPMPRPARPAGTGASSAPSGVTQAAGGKSVFEELADDWVAGNI